MFLLLLLYYCFSIPYVIGVSGGYRMYKIKPWLGFNMFLNMLYIIDTFMYFFRAYYDENGKLVYNLRMIRRKYFFSSYFWLNLVACFPAQAILYATFRVRGHVGAGEPFDPELIYPLQLFQLLRLIRITRIRFLAKSSLVFREWWERQDVVHAMLAYEIFMLTVVAHWISCIWSLIALIEAGTFGDALADEPNWISQWMDQSYVDGGINPIGWENDIERYGLSLFWSIQSITSIGYGNISPVTVAEYYFANFLMLLSGIFWAYIIGKIIGIAQYISADRMAYKRKMEEMNEMIGCFSPKVGDKDEATDTQIGVGRGDIVAQRMRRFVSNHYDSKALDQTYGDFNTETLEQIFPSINGLSPELRRLASIHLMRKYFELVPYLSSAYLSTEEQSRLAFKCKFLEMSRGELYTTHPKYGRGIMILRKGFVIRSGSEWINGVYESPRFATYGTDKPIGVDDSLVEDEYLGMQRPAYRFISYSLVIFIPQSVVYEVLSTNRDAWRDCARWRYLRVCLRKWARDRRFINDHRPVIDDRWVDRRKLRHHPG